MISPKKLVTMASNMSEVYKAGLNDGIADVEKTVGTIRPRNIPLYSKLKAIADKVKHIYDSGRTSAARLKTSVSGSVINVTDVNPVEHNVGCNVSSKNILDISTTKAYYNETISIDNDTITITPPTSKKIYGLAWTVTGLFKVGETYTLNVESVSWHSSSWGFQFRYEDGTYSNVYIPPHTYKLSKVPIGLHLILDWSTTEVPDETITLVKPQIELGSTATPYTPHISDFSSVNVTRYGKNLLDMSKFIGKTVSANGGTLTFNEDGSVTGSGTPTGYVSSSISDKLYLPLGKYILCARGDYNNISCSVSLYNSSGTLIGSAGVSNGYSRSIIDLTDTTKYPDFSYLQYSVKRNANNVELTGTVYFQLEFGDTATEYEFALKPVAHTANADGTVTGIKSVSPNMVFMSNNEGVIMDCVYFKKDAE